MSAPRAGRFRTGRKLGRTIYCDDSLIGMMDSAAVAWWVVELMNRAEATGETPWPPRLERTEPTPCTCTAASTCHACILERG